MAYREDHFTFEDNQERFFDGYCSAPGIISMVGYHGCEIIQTEAFFPEHIHAAVQSLDPAVAETLKFQGSDFFGSAFNCYFEACLLINMGCTVINKIAPENSITPFIHKNYNYARTAVAYAGLTVHELMQTQGNLEHFDYKDMIAYTAGIATICHGKEIVQGIGKLFSKAINAITGAPEETVPPLPRHSFWD